MNEAQIIYAIALAAVFAAHGPTFSAWVLLANMAATLVACLAMDLGALDRTGATMTMMVIDFASGAVLLTKPGQSRLIAMGYAVTVPIYAGTILAGIAESTTFAIVIGIGFCQLVVVGIGSGGGHGLRRRSGRSDVFSAVSVQGGDYRVLPQSGRVRDPHVPKNSGWW